MTPKEKADELVKKMYAVHSNSASDITLHFAKQCAMIAVDEILSNPLFFSDWGELHFWQQVKQEIVNINTKQ
jgi:hypothetical protein